MAPLTQKKLDESNLNISPARIVTAQTSRTVGYCCRAQKGREVRVFGGGGNTCWGRGARKSHKRVSFL